MAAKLLENFRNWLRPAEQADAPSLVPSPDDASVASLVGHALIVDDEVGICKIIAMTLTSMGVESECFH